VVPADVVMLAVHEPNPEQPDGICYLETKSLDGETNLKIRQTVQATLGKIMEPHDLAPFKVGSDTHHK
jgi:magnesium-transporting ATPase (P-type)